MDRELNLVDDDIEGGFLTCNDGYNGRCYFWFLDDVSVAIDMDGSITDESNKNETLNGILYCFEDDYRSTKEEFLWRKNY